MWSALPSDPFGSLRNRLHASLLLVLALEPILGENDPLHSGVWGQAADTRPGKATRDEADGWPRGDW